MDESFDRHLSHVKKSVLHHKFGLHQEFLEFARLVALLGVLIETVPWAAEVLCLVWILCKVRLYDVLDLVDPGFLQIIGYLTGR
jgi:hypothetical protein